MGLTDAERTDFIRREALGLGFSHVGFARAEALHPERELLLEWLSRGYHAGMSWMARDPEKRTDPRFVLPDARSVIVTATNYYHPERHVDAEDTGKISRYAWGDDYHDVVGPRMDALCTIVQAAAPGSVSRWYVDTGPSMDKAWAVRAGIGWLGKHGNVITRSRGSWVFLGVLFTTAQLLPDSPIPDFCGTCTRCMDACPTDAIVEARVVDSNRCIPYVTIELKDERIDAITTAELEKWIFGCDICQDVCPWNRFQQPSGDSAFAPRPHAVTPSLSASAEIDDASFRELYRGSPVARCKPRGFRRNARHALGIDRGEHQR